MPMPSVLPTPLPARESRRAPPLEEHEASYLAASASTASFCINSIALHRDTDLSHTLRTLGWMQPGPGRYARAGAGADGDDNGNTTSHAHCQPAQQPPLPHGPET